jgi:hypothetical protein
MTTLPTGSPLLGVPQNKRVVDGFRVFSLGHRHQIAGWRESGFAGIDATLEFVELHRSAVTHRLPR